MKKGRLEIWWPGVVEGAKAVVRKEADESGAEMARESEEMKEFEERGTNGITHDSVETNDLVIDGQGDTVMG